MYLFVSQLVQPITALLITLVLIALSIWRKRKELRTSHATSLVLVAALLYATTTPYVGGLALYSLERLAPPAEPAVSPNDVVVVLSGSLVPEGSAGNIMLPGTETTARCLHALRLYRRAGGCRILVSGGKVDPSEPGPTYAQAMADFLTNLGVSSSDILIEERSRTTLENARFSMELIGPSASGRVVLVTDAAHMYRAVRCFEAQGVAVVPAPCNHRTLRRHVRLLSFVPSSSGASQTSDAVHEWLGIVSYRVRGEISL